MFLKQGGTLDILFYLFMACSDSLWHLISLFLQDFILEHYSEDSYLYEDEIADLMDLRQVRCWVRRGGWCLQNVLLGNRGWWEVIGRCFRNHPFHLARKKMTARDRQAPWQVWGRFRDSAHPSPFHPS